MREINSILNLPQADEKKKDAEFTELLKNPALQQLCREQKIPQIAVRNNLGAFGTWLKECSVCHECKGLAFCRQKKKGYRMGLRYDGIIQYVLEACPYQAKKEDEESFLSEFLINDAGDTFAKADFLKIDWLEEQPRYARPAMQVQKLYSQGKGVYLYGSMGTGKTYLAACACNAVAKNGKQPAFVYAPAFAERISRYKNDEAMHETSLMKYADLLVLDDVGAEEITSRYLSQLLAILDSRMTEGKTTWFTSNEDYRSLTNRYQYAVNNASLMQAKRVMERIRALAEPVRLEGDDRRSLSTIPE